MLPRLVAAIAVLAGLLGAGAPPSGELNWSFPSAQAEAAQRTAALAAVAAFVAEPAPANPAAMLAWLRRSDALRVSLQRHDAYVYVRSEEDDRDVADARADETLEQAMDRIADRIVDVVARLGAPGVGAYLRVPALAPYRYLLESSLARAAHRLTPGDARAVRIAVTPVLDAAALAYKALRKSPDPIAQHEDAYAALLVSIVAAQNGIAGLRGFDGAPAASAFDKDLTPASIARTLEAVRGASSTYARYRSVAATLGVLPSPSPVPVAAAIPMILAAEQPMGETYAAAYRRLLDPRSGRLDVCTGEHCDAAGFSVGYSGVESMVFYGKFDGSLNAMRALAHESGHAVHRAFMSEGQPIAAYNEGPHFLFESFAIFNELLFLDGLYRAERRAPERIRYLNAFVDDATFQVFGSAREVELETAIYRGVASGELRAAPDFDALAARTFSAYDPEAAADPATAAYWARDRLFFTDPLYDVNYLYAGLLALRYYADFQRRPAEFSRRYVAMLRNGFDRSPAQLEKTFLGIDLNDEPALVNDAVAIVDARTAELARLAAPAATPPAR